MQKFFKSRIWLAAALLFFVQTLLPVSALATVRMRCVGMPSAAGPCAHMVLPAAQMGLAQKLMAAMPCCRHMHSPCALSKKQNVPSTTFSANHCAISIQILSVERVLTASNPGHGDLITAPALMPRDFTAHISSLQYPIDRISNTTPLNSAFHFVSHGLRAPPVA